MNKRCNRVILYTLETVLSQSIVVSRVIVINRVRYKEVRLYFIGPKGGCYREVRLYYYTLFDTL